MTKIKQTKNLIKTHYLADSRPLVVTFSGGKDSTTVLQLTIEVLQELKAENKITKDTYIVSSDTLVEMPIIEEYLNNTLSKIDKYCKQENLRVTTHLIKPKEEDSFFSLMIGKGYPAPNKWFRWCTDRLKIKPTTDFLSKLVDKHQSILMLLGVRIDESISRAISIKSRELNYKGLSPHDQIPNAYVLSPIKDWSNQEVWTFLTECETLWGNHKLMMSLYDKGSSEADCNIALNPESPSCGKTRFGCWTCTVVDKDKSMNGMIKSGEEWMLPLWDYREKLLKYRNDENKRNKRRKNAQRGLGDFTLATREELLEDIFKIEKMSEFNKRDIELISDIEIELIQKNWDKDGDIENSALKLAKKYERLKSKSVENSQIENILSELNINFSKELFKRVYEIEVNRKNLSNRVGILQDIESRVKNYSKGLFVED